MFQSILSQRPICALSSLPAKRKVAGLNAHRKVYKQLMLYTSFGKVNKFLGLQHICPKKVKYKLFFEVSLGPRIADIIVLASQGEQRMCYIIELKTCLGAHFVPNPIKLAQRSQGLCQLHDSTKYLCNNAPRGEERWVVQAHLLFKSQVSLKTLHSEHPTFPFALIQSKEEALSAFLRLREDAEFKQVLRQGCPPAEVAKGMRLLGPKPQERARYKPPKVPRAQAQRLALPKARGRKQNASHKKGAVKNGA
ncbi:ORF20 [Ovine gammaherpesvirus 2]|uniref:ORF20 n=1 Tax=Ovine gammaherpesvirus 2 TaxID=10398 RepID=Q2VSM0_9GAMA|nr:ORF20 [Ovine gammaherpesvirus 2]AAX58056.1 ORF20 [Ovine gammaherpesvirus 2]ABB22238.1 hypothetical protein OvHV-2gp18 [Ovine gammaherpesvirus 2]WOZ69465.1 ORF20 nuclear protein [Ovine gammaherpesvirus 2]